MRVETRAKLAHVQVWTNVDRANVTMETLLRSLNSPVAVRGIHTTVPMLIRQLEVLLGSFDRSEGGHADWASVSGHKSRQRVFQAVKIDLMRNQLGFSVEQRSATTQLAAPLAILRGALLSVPLELVVQESPAESRTQ